MRQYAGVGYRGSRAGSLYDEGLFAIAIRVEKDYIVLSVQVIQILFGPDMLQADACFAIVVPCDEFQLFSLSGGRMIKLLEMVLFFCHFHVKIIDASLHAGSRKEGMVGDIVHFHPLARL